MRLNETEIPTRLLSELNFYFLLILDWLVFRHEGVSTLPSL